MTRSKHGSYIYSFWSGEYKQYFKMSITDGLWKKFFYRWQSQVPSNTTMVCYLQSQLKYKLKTAENDNIVCFFHPSPWAPGIRTTDPSLRALSLDSASCVKWRWVSTTAIITVIFISGFTVFSKSSFKNPAIPEVTNVNGLAVDEKQM